MRYTVVFNRNLQSFQIEIEPEYLDYLLSDLDSCRVCHCDNCCRCCAKSHVKVDHESRIISVLSKENPWWFYDLVEEHEVNQEVIDDLRFVYDNRIELK